MTASTQLLAVAAALDVAARREDATAEDRAHCAGTAAVLRLRQTGVEDVEKLRAASRAARAACADAAD